MNLQVPILYSWTDTCSWQGVKSERFVLSFDEGEDYEREEVYVNSNNCNGVASTTNRLKHMPLFDVDVPADKFNRDEWTKAMEPIWYPFDFYFVQSRSGKVHVYLNKSMFWAEYVKMLEHAILHNLCDPKWAELAIKRGYSVLRLPPMSKGF